MNACLICSDRASLITGHFCLCPCAVSEPDFYSFINITACEFPSAIEVAEICFEGAAITDTQPAWCCMHSHASTVYLLVVDC